MIITDNAEWRVERVSPPEQYRFSLLERMIVERGTVEDWNQLHELHYKEGKLGVGPLFFRCKMGEKLIGVSIMSVPGLTSRARNKMFPWLCPNRNGMDNKLVNSYRAHLINRLIRVNSRIVVDPVFRSVGVAYRLQNLAMRMSGFKILEFQSSMSRINPFALKAGVKFGEPERSTYYEHGLEVFRRWFDGNPADYVELLEELDSFSPAVRERCLKELHKWYYDHSAREKSGNNRFNSRERVAAKTPGELIKSLQQLVLAAPLYGAYKNPDFERALPERLPLLAFDNQPTDQPLDLEKLCAL